MLSRKLILTLSAAVCLSAVTAANADAPSTRIALKHLTPKPMPVMVKESGPRTRVQYGFLEYGLNTIGTLTTGAGPQSAK